VNDLRFGLRMFGRSPLANVAIAVLLAIGVGASTTIFSLFDAVLLRPLPVRRPEQLVRMVRRFPRIGTRSVFKGAYYEALRDHSTTLASVFAATGQYSYFTMTEPLPAEQITVHLVTPEYFAVLGVQTLCGRALTAEDAKPASTVPMVLSYGFWQRRFHTDPKALGHSVVIHGHPFVVVGILPREFNGITADTAPDARVPLRALPLLADGPMDAPNGSGGGYEVAGRLKPGVTRERAQAECLALFKSVSRNEPPEGSSPSMELEPLERGVSILRDRSGGVLELLMAAAGLLLVLVTVNIAGLLLARCTARQQEMAMRLAVGATRARLIRQMIMECLPLGVLGSAGGLGLAKVAIPLAVRALPPIRDPVANMLTLAVDAHIDGRVLAFSVAASVLALLLFGLAPALSASCTSLDGVLRAARSTGRGRGRQILVCVQIALCTLLLAGASLFVRTFENLNSVNPGFDRSRIATFTLDLSGLGYTPKTEQAFLQKLITSVSEIPGVISAAVALRGVMRGRGMSGNVGQEGQRITDFLNANANMVSPGYFETMGMHLLAGRSLVESDASPPTPNTPTNAVTNRAFAERFFSGRNPLGKRFGLGPPGTVAKGQYVIVGVVSDAKYRSLREPIMPLYFLGEIRSESVVLNVRTRVLPQSIFQPVSKALASLDPSLAFLEIHTMEEELSASTSGERLMAVLASLFGGLAAVVAGLGLYASLAYVVARRGREIGIRMALGARPADIVALTSRQSFTLGVAGIVIGLGGALVAGPSVRALIYGVSPSDPASLTTAAILVGLVATIATIVPAMRAARVQPASVLREEN
jgi:predicted permease